jgi:hypothetical protein
VLHASTFLVSALTAAAWLPWLVIGLPVGAWVDRLPRRPVLIVPTWYRSWRSPACRSRPGAAC